MQYCGEVQRVEFRRRNTMDISHDTLSHISTLKQSKDYTIAFGRMTPKPKPSFNKDNTKHRIDEEKRDEKKLFRTKPPLCYRKVIPASKGRIDIAGEPNSVPRKCRTLPTKRLETQKIDKKVKASHIPMRKFDPLNKKPSKEKNQNLLCQNKNVQRVQVYNTVPDFSEMLDVPVSLASTKPIPTLGQIYGNSIMGSDVFNDFFLGPVTENLEMPFVSPDLSDNISNRSPESINTITSTNRGPNFFRFTGEDHPAGLDLDPEHTMVSEITPRSNVNYHSNVFQTTNDNVRDWLAYELDHPTRDNESGYHSDSRAKIVSNGVKSNASLDPKVEIMRKYSLLLRNRAQTKKSVSATDISKSSGGESMTVQETVLIAPNSKTKAANLLLKMNTDTKPLKPPNKFYATFKFPSAPNPAQAAARRAPVASYVECPSEVLQKTTNFESEGHDTSSTDKELSLNDELSSQAVGDTDDMSSATEQLEQLEQLDWRVPSSRASAVRSSKGSETTEGSWRRRDDLNQYKPSSDFSFYKCAANCSYHEYYYHYCWRRQVASRERDFQKLRDSVGRCKKCQQYRRYTHQHDKISKRFVDLKNRMSFGRGCRHRWNRVWKKTTQRFSKWSKSPSKMKKFRMMHYLLQKNNWDNAVAQTTVLIYNERGTDAVSRAIRSIATDKQNDTIASATSATNNNNSDSNHVNVGPSTFSFITWPRLPMMSEAISIQKSNPFQNVKRFVESMDKNGKEKDDGIRQLSKSTSCEVMPSEKTDNGTVTDSFPITSTLLTHFKDQLPQNVCTQMIIACHNAATDIKFNPTLEASATTSEIYCDSKCTSDNTVDDKNYVKPTSVTPEVSNTKISTGTITFETGFLDTSSVVTDTIVPSKRLENKGFTTLTTPNGTVLSCGGTKITSVSSVNLQPNSMFYRTKYIANTAMSTNCVSTRNMVCHTAPSLYRHQLKDVCLGPSTTNLVDKSSISCGSYPTQRSFNAEFRPNVCSMSTNTDCEMTSRGVIMSNMLVADDKKTNDACAQYSYRDKNADPQTLDSGRIGRSRLLSVRMLGDSCSDVDTQARPATQDAETYIAPKDIVSASVLTSRFDFAKIVNLMKVSKEINTDEPKLQVTKTWSSLPSKSTDVKQEIQEKQEKQEKPENSNEESSAVKSTVDQKSSTAAPRNPSVVISSNLNAAKWIHGYTKDDYQSVIDISEMTVSESLERASLALAHSQYKQNDPENDKQPDDNCVNTDNIDTILSECLKDEIPVKDEMPQNETVTESYDVHVEKDASDAKNLDKSSLQVRHNTCDTGCPSTKSSVSRRSAAALTSRHFLARPPMCPRTDQSECLYVYDRARCIVHSPRADTAVQSESTHSRHGRICKHKKSHKSMCSVGLAMSRNAVSASEQTSTALANNELRSRSIQAAVPAAPHTCPFCSRRLHEQHDDDAIGTDSSRHARLSASCRHYSGLVARNISRMRDHLKRRIIVEHIDNNPRAGNNILCTEACTMKPSGRRDQTFQATISSKIQANVSSKLCAHCALAQTSSDIDIRGDQSHDLQTLYYILTAIEGRIRRLKNKL